MDRYGRGGSAVVLLHGFGTCSFLWRAVAPQVALARHTAFAIDLLGYGQSDRPFDAEFGLAAQAEYLDRALTALRISRAVLVGVDVGGGVALRVAATRPERVERLVLINSVGFDELPGRDVKTIQRNTARFALRVARGVLGVAPLLTPVLEASVARPERMPTRLVARYLAPYVGQEGVSHLLALARALRPDELEDLDLATIAQPTLIVWGESDPWLDASLADRFAETIPRSQLIRLPGVGRLMPEEEPDLLARLLIDFAEGRRTDTPPDGVSNAGDDVDDAPGATRRDEGAESAVRDARP